MVPGPGTIAYSNAICSPPLDVRKSIDLDNVAGKTILITGGASGIGAAIATALALHGANIIIGDRNESKGHDLIARLRTSSNRQDHHYLTLDVLSWASQVAFFRRAAELSPHKGIDVVIANAGINDPDESQLFELDVPDYTKLENPEAPPLKTLHIDLDGVMYTATLALSYLNRNPSSEACTLEKSAQPRDRHLILVSSIAGVLGLPGQSIYGAAKHGVLGLFRSLRLSAPILHGVRVNCIFPYYVDTPILDIRGHMPLLGLGMTKIEHVVEAVTRLCADQTIVGRGLLIGAEATEEQVRAVGLGDTNAKHVGGAIWDIYGEDFEQTDLLMRRVMGLLNLITAARGWAGYFSDLALRIRQLIWRGA